MNHARFKLASKLGVFRDSYTFQDPFGTGASFTVLRSGSERFRQLSEAYIDTDPMAQLEIEMALSGDSLVNVLTGEEQTIVDDLRKSTETGVTRLLPIIDRLTSSAGFMMASKETVKRAIESGKVRASEYFRRNRVKRVADATNLLLSWSNMPGEEEDENGNTREVMVDFTPDNVADLFANETPIEEDGPLSDIVKGIPALYSPSWNDEKKELGTVFTPNLTMGEAYLRIIFAAANNRDNFRAKVMEEAGKNSDPSSDLTN